MDVCLLFFRPLHVRCVWRRGGSRRDLFQLCEWERRSVRIPLYCVGSNKTWKRCCTEQRHGKYNSGGRTGNRYAGIPGCFCQWPPLCQNVWPKQQCLEGCREPVPPGRGNSEVVRKSDLFTEKRTVWQRDRRAVSVCTGIFRRHME